MDIKEIKKYLPHRYPFLLVDRVLEIDQDKGVAVKNVTSNEPFFQGHFPQRPVMPGVLIVEAMAQTAGIVWYRRNETPGKIAFLAGLDSVRFREPVVPGDQLIIETKLVKKKAQLIMAEGKAKVGDKVVCEAKLMFVVVQDE